ncbi:MAG: DeoR family transcriptional regulator [Candidatus Paceibacterota bacterium]
MQSINDKTQSNAQDSGISQNDNTTRVAYVSGKTQRLASALYAITRVFPSEEPLRGTLRRQALSLVSSAHMLADGTPDETLLELSGLLKRLLSQLAVARDGGLISYMNFRVLREEIDTFITEVNDLGAFPGPHLDSGYFNNDLPTLQSGHETTRKASPRDSSSLGRDAAAGSGANTAGNSAKKAQLSTKDKRRQKILDLFNKTDEITVNDVTDVVNGYSTKTIQRDLKALVKIGQLEKHGKRRWTSYTKV